MLKLLGYQKIYYDVPVLSIPDLFLKTGIYWLKGTNGSGKSTLLKSLAGILHFNGNVYLNQGISLKKDALSYRKMVNFSPAEPVYPEFLTGMEMIKMFATAKSAKENQEQAYIEQMNMSSYINQELGSYSSGMLKKLSLLLAFLGNPSLILLDEPLITVDKESLQILYSWIAEKHEKYNCSFIIASHQYPDKNALSITHELSIADQAIKII